jgi:hypothetical protein
MRTVLALAAAAALLQAPAALAGGFPTGQCTTWAFKMRPDIVADTALQAPAVSDWNAYMWAADARQGGFTVGTRAAVGAIVVWPQNTLGSGPVGHVAYVERVRADGSFYVSEEDFDGRPAVHHRWVAPSSALQFIYLQQGESVPKGPTHLGGELDGLTATGLFTTNSSQTSVKLTLSAPGTVAMRLTGPGVDRSLTGSFHGAGGWQLALNQLAGTSSLPAGNYTLTAFSYDSGIHRRWVTFRLA